MEEVGHGGEQSFSCPSCRGKAQLMNIRTIRTMINIEKDPRATPGTAAFARSLVAQWRGKMWLTPKQWAAADRVAVQFGYDVAYRPRIIEVTFCHGVVQETATVPEGFPVIRALMREYSSGLERPVLRLKSGIECMLETFTERMPKWKGSRREWNRTIRAHIIDTTTFGTIGTIDHTGVYEPVEVGCYPRTGIMERVREVIASVDAGEFEVIGTIWKDS